MLISDVPNKSIVALNALPIKVTQKDSSSAKS